MIQMKNKEKSVISINDNSDDNYKKNAVDGDREYDLCLVLENRTVEDKCVFNIIVKKLSDAGLELYIYPSALQYDEDHKSRRVEEVHATFHRDTLTFDEDSKITEDTLIFILIRSNVQTLKDFADENDFKMLLDANVLKDIIETGKFPEGKNIKQFKIPYPEKSVRAEDIFLQSAIPPEQGCCPFSCRSLTAFSYLSPEQKDLIPYENMYGRFEEAIDRLYPGLYVDPSIPYSERATVIASQEGNTDGRDPFGEQQRLKLTAMMFQKVIKGILRQGAIGTNKINRNMLSRAKLGASEKNAIMPDDDYIDLAISAVETSMPNKKSDTQKERLERRTLVIDSIRSQLNKFYALHHRVKIDHLTNVWLSKWSVMPWNQPFHDIRNYFGEKIAIYYVFIGHYCLWLLIPVIIGIPLQFGIWGVLLERKTNDDHDDHNLQAPNSNNYFAPVFSFFIALWAICMLEFWKRKEKTVAIEWGTVGCEDDEPDRPTFRGDYNKHITSFIDGHEGYQYYPARKRSRKVIQAYIVISFCMLCVFAIVSSIYYTQNVARHAQALGCNTDDIAVRTTCYSNAQTIASTLNAVQIQFTNVMFTTVAWYFTERENNRTDTIFQDSLTIKIFIFQFVNSFASFYYIAFVAHFVGGCTPATSDNDCMGPLSTNVGIIYVTRIVSSVVFDIIMPYGQHAKKAKGRSAEELKMLSGPEFEYEMDAYNTIDQSMKDYSAMALHFGYIALFITALPIAGFLGFISAIIEVKNSAWKLLSVYRRPVPTSAEDIGAWQSIFLIIAIAAVATNAGITCFTMTVLNNKSWSSKEILKVKLWTFIIFQWVCYVTQAIIMEAIPDIPEQAIYHLQRNEHIVSKVIDHVEDDDDHDKAFVDVDDDVKPSTRTSNFSVEIQDNPSAFYKRDSLYKPKKHPFVSLFVTPKEEKNN